MDVDDALDALGLPPWEELEPFELRYLRTICRWLQEHPGPEPRRDPDDFDADELGIDPEPE